MVNSNYHQFSIYHIPNIPCILFTFLSNPPCFQFIIPLSQTRKWSSGTFKFSPNTPREWTVKLIWNQSYLIPKSLLFPLCYAAIKELFLKNTNWMGSNLLFTFLKLFQIELYLCVMIFDQCTVSLHRDWPQTQWVCSKDTLRWPKSARQALEGLFGWKPVLVGAWLQDTTNRRWHKAPEVKSR